MNYIDPTGHWLFQALAGVFNGAVRGVSKIITNAVTGRPVFEHVTGAAIGGFVEGVTYTTTFNATASSYAGALAENVVNEGEDFIVQKRAFTWENVKKSMGNVGKNTLIDGTVGAVIGKTRLGAPAYSINKGWYQPQSVKSFIKGRYVHKLMINQLKDAMLNATKDVMTKVSTAYAPGEKIRPTSTKKTGTQKRPGRLTPPETPMLQAAQMITQSVMSLMNRLLKTAVLS